MPFVVGEATGLGVDGLVADLAEGSPSNTSGVADVDISVDPEAVDEPVDVDTLDTTVPVDSKGASGGLPRDWSTASKYPSRFACPPVKSESVASLSQVRSETGIHRLTPPPTSRESGPRSRKAAWGMM